MAYQTTGIVLRRCAVAELRAAFWLPEISQRQRGLHHDVGGAGVEPQAAFDLGLALGEVVDHRKIRCKRDMRLGVERIDFNRLADVALHFRERSDVVPA
jgi:hypothetical protein